MHTDRIRQILIHFEHGVIELEDAVERILRLDEEGVDDQTPAPPDQLPGPPPVSAGGGFG